MTKNSLKGAYRLKFLKRFFDGIQRDLRLFVFVLILLEIYRGLFIFVMSNYMSAESGAAQIFTAMWAGLRLSLKTAGAVTLISFVFVTIGGLRARLRLLIGIVASLIFSLLFMLRFPYYRAFQSTFGLEVVQGFHDDLWSIIVTMFQEYGIAWRFLVALILTIICIAALSRLLIIKTFPLPELVGKKKIAGFSEIRRQFHICERNKLGERRRHYRRLFERVHSRRRASFVSGASNG